MKWQHSLYTRLALSLAAVLMIVGMSYSAFSLYMARHLNQSAAQKLSENLARGLVEDRRIVKNGKIDQQAMEETFHDYMVINPSIEIYYLDPAGNILAYSAKAGVVKRKSIDLAPIKAFMAGEKAYPLLGDDPRSHDQQKPFSVTPIPDQDNCQGYLYVVLQGQEFAAAHAAEAQKHVLGLGLTALAGSLALGLMAGLVIFQQLTGRLRRLQNAVKHFADDGFKQAQTPLSLPLESKPRHDEIAELEQHFHAMAEHIAEQWHALQQQDSLRRELIATISHDLRTPLTAMQGFLDTLVLKPDLSASQRLEYTQTALKQSHRLQKLIHDLFELAKLEARDTQPEFEHFSILELAYDVCAKFSTQAQQRQLALRVEPHASDAIVYADIGLIERVLDNLISNAMRFTPAGGEIVLNILARQQQVEVAVRDTGSGISPQQQSLIFERFHQVNNPQRSGEHAGLGLAIVKKIIELHQQKIWLESDLGRGSCFHFTLPIQVHA